MKTFTKFFGIIAIATIIAAGVSACISISPAPGPSEEQLALRKTLQNATWEVKRLADPPSLNGFEKISKTGYGASEWAIMEEVNYFRDAAGDGEKDRGRTSTWKVNGVERTITYIGMDNNKWYELSAPERPGITYYYYSRMASSGLGKLEIYKKGK
jgi:hypothetical protein